MTESLYLLVPLSVILVFIIGALFWWSIRNGQYDDLEGPAYQMLMDDQDNEDSANPSSTETNKSAHH